MDSQGSSPDDELGHSLLFSSLSPSVSQGGLAFFNWDTAIACEAVRTARSTFENQNEGRVDARGIAVHLESASDQFRSRADFWSQIHVVLGSVVPERVSALRQPSLFLDYEPWVRSMVAADDVMEAAAVEDVQGTKRGGRLTRNSQRQDHVRYFRFSSDQLGTLRDTAFRVEDTLSEVEEDHK